MLVTVACGRSRRCSRVIILIHRRKSISLLGLPVSRYIDVHDSSSLASTQVVPSQAAEELFGDKPYLVLGLRACRGPDGNAKSELASTDLAWADQRGDRGIRGVEKVLDHLGRLFLRGPALP